MRIIDTNARLFEAWASVEVIDKQGDIIPVKEIAKVVDGYMARGGAIMDSHSNRHVGKVIDYAIKENEKGIKGLYIVGQIFKDSPTFDEVWEKIKKGEYKGISFGGRTHLKEYKYDAEKGLPIDILRKLEMFELSVCETPANQEALITAVSIAKTDRDIFSCPKCKTKMRGALINTWDALYCPKCGYFEDVNGHIGYLKDFKEDFLFSPIRQPEYKKKQEDITLACGFDFDSCVRRVKAQGKNEDSARTICGKAKHEAEKMIWKQKCIEISKKIDYDELDELEQQLTQKVLPKIKEYLSIDTNLDKPLHIVIEELTRLALSTLNLPYSYESIVKLWIQQYIEEGHYTERFKSFDGISKTTDIKGDNMGEVKKEEPTPPAPDGAVVEPKEHVANETEALARIEEKLDKLIELLSGQTTKSEVDTQSGKPEHTKIGPTDKPGPEEENDKVKIIEKLVKEEVAKTLNNIDVSQTSRPVLNKPQEEDFNMAYKIAMGDVRVSSFEDLKKYEKKR